MEGVYAVFFQLEEEKIIEIGALGEKKFQAGLYVYIGSAMNSIEKRVERHFSSDKKLHWHIDYFSLEADPVYWLAFPLPSRFECILAECAAEKGVAVDEFGASDCNCNSHLYRLDKK
ncbi:GIY-YIG nuclease family protein [Candidatus Nanosalina sp. VS9-1]|uniref:GIY-YIG nuclease family protein n=1 Tax=Candidatus Nanosalina sp. VS9-1 TaxID=3388566 RepID=UPI0039DFDD2D